MNYFNVKSYIRLIGGIINDDGKPKLTPEQINNADENFSIIYLESTNKFEINTWDLPIKKPTINDLKALISKDDIRREKKIFLRKQSEINVHSLLMRKKFLKKLFPNLDEIIEEYINEEVEENA